MKRRIAVWLHGGIGTGHFSQGYPPLEKLLNGLSASFQIVLYSKSPVSTTYRPSNFTIRSAPAKIKPGVVRWIYLVFYFLRDHRSKRYGLLFAFWGYPAGLMATCLAMFVRIPSAVYLLGSDSFGIAPINFGIFHKPLLRSVACWAYKRSSLLLGISEFQKKNLQAHGIPNIKIIPWGIEKNHYPFVDKKRDATLRVIHVGHLTPVKDQVTLIKAFAMIAKQRQAELRIYGTDCLNGAIQKLVAEHGLDKHVRFLDMAPYYQMPEFYKWADVMLHTSIVEGQSMALTEAAASGVLLAGTRVGLLYDLGDACGITVNVGDFEGLAAHVLAILDDQKSWNEKIQNAKAWAHAHDMQWTTDELKKNLNALLNNERPDSIYQSQKTVS